jgi:selenocysteine-specific elongation factor
VLGTAGHIDHGKSSLVKALTGTDPDRLKEEKKRGITIELGFARLSLPDNSVMSVVDVPGHERFVRQMISGATGIDVAMLCIAADDGVMPQTVEHLAVLELLGVSNLVIALTKVDLVDDDWLSFITQEVTAFLVGSSFENSPIIATSSQTGVGLEKLRDTLLKAAHDSCAKPQQKNVRLPIDRVFSIKGAGTVVTGTLWSGTLALGDELEIVRTQTLARIRSIQSHDVFAEQVQAGNRVALNLASVKTTDIRPGDFLTTPKTIRVAAKCLKAEHASA